MVRINESERALIVERMKNGHKQSDVARELGLGQISVKVVWQRYIDTGSSDDRHKTGRPRKTSERKRRNICRQSKLTPFSSPRELFRKLHFVENISLRTVRRRFIWKMFSKKTEIKQDSNWCTIWCTLSRVMN